MALSVPSTRDCKFISSTVTYSSATATFPMTGYLLFTDYAGNSLGQSAQVTITNNGGNASVITPVSNLSISNGVVRVEFYDSANSLDGDAALLLHCDIDCCLAKLTNELIDCACDCAKCASSLAKAQKVFLLIKSAEHSLDQISAGSGPIQTGDLVDAHTKYTKAKEICDNSCGCDC